MLEVSTDVEAVALISRHSEDVMSPQLSQPPLLYKPSAISLSPTTNTEFCSLWSLTLNSGMTFISLHYHWTLIHVCSIFVFDFVNLFPMMYVPFVFVFYDTIITPLM